VVYPDNGLDTIAFDVASESDVELMQSGDDIILKIVGTDQTIDVRNDLGWSNGPTSLLSSITFADGGKLDLTQMIQRPITFTYDGTLGGETLTGGNANGDAFGNSLFKIGPNDIVVGVHNYGGTTFTNTYSIDGDIGHSTITTGTGSDILEFGAGISASDIEFEQANDDLIVKVAGTSDVIDIKNDLGWTGGPTSAITTIAFADGTRWDLTHLLQTPLTFTYDGTAGNETLIGGNSGASAFGNNVFKLGLNDIVTGANNFQGTTFKNTYSIGGDVGHSTITPGTNSDILEFGAGILASDLEFEQANDDLIVKVAGTSDVIDIKNDLGWTGGPTSEISTIAFADGTSIDLTHLLQTPLTFMYDGTAGNETLAGGNTGHSAFGNYVFELGPNDTVTGANDYGGTAFTNTYLVEGDVGHSAITLGTSSDILEFGAGISASDVEFEQANDDLIIKVAGTSDAIDIPNDLGWVGGPTSVLSAIAFADGTRWDLTHLLQTPLTFTYDGTAGNETLVGGNNGHSAFGNYVFELGPNDMVTGANNYGGTAFTNTYLVEGDVGHSTITLGTSSDILEFGAGYSNDQLWLVRSGQNLQIDIMGTENELTVSNWFGNTGNTLGDIATADGLKIDSGISSLVQAMATFSNQNPGFNPTAVAQAPTDATLQNAIAVAWHH
jgi:hypothetical protein